MTITIDVKDRKILSELDMDARQPLSALAKKVGLSREVVQYRIRQLEKKKIITGYVTVLDTSRLGLIYCRILFKFRKMPASKEKEFLSYCMSSDAISWIILGEGKWDIVLVALAKDLQSIGQLTDEINSNFGIFLQNPYVTIAYEVHEFKHNYLYPKFDDRELVLGRSSQVAKLDLQDMKLLSLLSSKARYPLISLSKKVSMDPRTVNQRIKKLLGEKVILGFRALINASLLGYDFYKIFLTLHGYDTKSKLISYLRFHPSVIYLTVPMGMHSLEFEAMVKNANELHSILHELKREFGEIIIDYDTYFTYETRLVGYLPKSLMKSNEEVALD